MICTTGCAVTLTCAMICSSQIDISFRDSEYVKVMSIDYAASRAGIAFLVIFGAVYAWGYQPLLGLYPSEVLSMEQRSTGLGVMVLTSNLAGKMCKLH